MEEAESLYQKALRILHRPAQGGVYDPHLGYAVGGMEEGPHPRFKKIYNFLVSGMGDEELSKALGERFALEASEIKQLIEARSEGKAEG